MIDSGPNGEIPFAPKHVCCRSATGGPGRCCDTLALST